MVAKHCQQEEIDELQGLRIISEDSDEEDSVKFVNNKGSMLFGYFDK